MMDSGWMTRVMDRATLRWVFFRSFPATIACVLASRWLDSEGVVVGAVVIGFCAAVLALITVAVVAVGLLQQSGALCFLGKLFRGSKTWGAD